MTALPTLLGLSAERVRVLTVAIPPSKNSRMFCLLIPSTAS